MDQQSSSQPQGPPPVQQPQQSLPQQQSSNRPPFPPGMRPPPPPIRPQMTTGQRPPMIPGQRPPMPPGARPSIPPGIRPPIPGLQNVNAPLRPPLPPGSIPPHSLNLAATQMQGPPMRPSLPVNNPPVQSSQAPPLRPPIPGMHSPNSSVPVTQRPPISQMRPPLPTNQAMPILAQSSIPPVPSVPTLSSVPQNPAIQSVPIFPAISPLAPPVPMIPSVPSTPSVPIMNPSNATSSVSSMHPLPSAPTNPLMPPISQQNQQKPQNMTFASPMHMSSMVPPPTMVHQNQQQIPSVGRPPFMPSMRPMTQMASPPRPPGPPIPGQQNQNPMQSAIRPPMPPPISPPVPNRPPLSQQLAPPVHLPQQNIQQQQQNQRIPQMPPLMSMSPSQPIQRPPMMPPMPIASNPNLISPMNNASLAPVGPSNQPQNIHPLNQPQFGQYPPPQQFQQQPPQQFQQQPPQQFQNNPFQSGYQASQHQGQPLPSAPLVVSSNSHNIKEFYEKSETLIKPNIDSDFLTCSLGKIPRNASILGKARTPFGLTVSFYPYGDAEKDKVAEINGPIVRCRRCRTYLNPFAELVEQGSRWRCNMCFLANEFPPNFDFDQVTQSNVDRKDHVEFKNFVYDFTNAPIEYTVRQPQPPIFLFILEITASAVNNGLFASSCRVIQEQLDSIPNEDSRARVGIITFDQRIHFYKLSPNEPCAKVLVVADAGEPFLPASSDLLVNLSECRTQLDSLLDQLPQMHSTPSKSSPALGPVLQSAHLLLKSTGGKVIVVMASLPTQFEGALKARDDLKLLGTNKESTLLQPANQFYKLFATEIIKDQICVDLFVAPPQFSMQFPVYTDLASISGLTKYTGGKLHYYPDFGTSDAITTKFCSDLRRFLAQPHGYEAVLRIRASHGVSLTSYHGSFFLRQSDLVSIPNVNPDHSFSAQASIEENLQGTVVYFQAALLHTTCRGERRIRVINYAAPITDDIKEIFSNINVNGIAGVLSKMAVEKVLANRLEDAREAVLNKCSDIIAAFKSQNGLKNNQNLLLPANMKNLPILLHGLIKSLILRSGNQTHPDLRICCLTLWKTLSASELIGLIIPRFYAIHSMESDCGVDEKLPNLLNLSSEKLERHGIFLLDNGSQQFLWIGSNVHQELLSMLFGTSTLSEITPGRSTQLIPELDNDWNRRLRTISEILKSKYGKNIIPEYFIIKEDSEPITRQRFLANLIEDRSIDGSSPSYAQWLMDVNSRVNSSSY